MKRWVAATILAALLFWAGFAICGWAMRRLYPSTRHYNVMKLVSSPPPRFFDGYLSLPNPRPEDCIIVPLENPKADHIAERHLVITA